METESLFAQNITIDDCRESIKGYHEFRETKKSVDGINILVFNYDYCHSKTFPDPALESDPRKRYLHKVRRECRGLIFDADTGLLLCRRFHKFFNVDQNEECSLAKIPFDKPHVIIEKFDGSLVSPFPIPQYEAVGSSTDTSKQEVSTNNNNKHDQYRFPYPFKIRFGSKQGPTELSIRIEEEFLPLQKNSDYMGFCRYWIERMYTPLFEWCSLKNHIVLNYEQDLLVLTAIRNNITGEYLTYHEICESAAQYGVQVTSILSLDKSQDTIHSFMETVKSQENIEGYILKFEHDEGSMFKLKTEWYFARSRQDLRLPNQEKELWGMILNNTLDDLMPCLIPETRNRLDEFCQLLFRSLEETGRELTAQVEALKQTGISKKDFVEMVKTNTEQYDPVIANLLFRIFSGAKRDLNVEIIDVVKKSLTNKDQFERARKHLAKGVKFEY